MKNNMKSIITIHLAITENTECFLVKLHTLIINLWKVGESPVMLYHNTWFVATLNNTTVIITNYVPLPIAIVLTHNSAVILFFVKPKSPDNIIADIIQYGSTICRGHESLGLLAQKSHP